MIVRDFREVAANPSGEAEGVAMRWVIAKNDGAPNFAMRVVEVQPGGSTPHHQHEWEHEVFVIEGQGVVRGSQGDRPNSTMGHGVHIVYLGHVRYLF